MQTVTSCQHLANFFISVAVVLVADGAAVIIHPVVNDVTMRMITVSMPGDDELRVNPKNKTEFFGVLYDYICNRNSAVYF